ncbi:MAG: ATP-binding protein, partial [Mycobacteriales bacterium]
RTARLVAGALARQVGLDDIVVDEVKLAVGEVCSRAVRLHEQHAPTTFVVVTFCDQPDLAVSVRDACPVTTAVSADMGALPVATADGAFGPALALAVVAGLVDDVAVEPDPDGSGGTRVMLRWPRPRAS